MTIRRFFFFRAMSGRATSIDEVGAAKLALRAVTVADGPRRLTLSA